MLVPDSALTLARIADVPAIAERSRTLIETGLPWSWVPRRVAASIRHPETNVVVARVREGIAGFGILRYGLEEAHLNLFAVDRAWRGQGIGRRLLEWLERPARVAGLARIVLEARTLERVPGYHGGREAAVRMGRAP